MRKKGDISINVIIIAIIALMVLVVLLMIFSGKMGDFSDKTGEIQDKSCSDVDGSAVVQETANCPDGYIRSLFVYKDVSAGYKCCRPDQTTLI